MTTLSCSPHLQDYVWNVSPAGVLHLRVAQWLNSPWLDCGKVEECLEAHADTVGELNWRKPYSEHDGNDAKLRILSENQRRAEDLLLLVQQSIGFAQPPPLWRMLYPNVVLHPQFGPGVTVSTDGSRVVLFHRPAFGADWMLVHRTNIIGPVCGSPTAVATWDYVNNKPKGAGFARKPKADATARALDMLRNAAKAL